MLLSTQPILIPSKFVRKRLTLQVASIPKKTCKEALQLRHLYALLIKTAMIGVVLWLIMNVWHAYPFAETVVLTLLLVGLSYLIGDLGILPMTNNTIATLSDVGLVTLTVWLIGPFIVGQTVPFYIALVSGILIGAGEWFVHPWLVKNVLPRKSPY
jgi:hypothetical protein